MSGGLDFNVSAASYEFRLEYSDQDVAVAQEVKKAVKLTLHKALKWGPLNSPVLIIIYPSHDSLALAIDRIGFPWLRAWAQYETIHIQSPRTWGIDYTTQLPELLAHELTHVVMYQNVAQRHDWAEKEVPLWFREGMASYSAEQGYRRGSSLELAKYLAVNEGVNPLEPSYEMLRLQKDLVYNSGHWSFTYLVSLAGEAAIRRVMLGMRNGLTFEESFQAACNMSSPEFVRRWRDHIFHLLNGTEEEASSVAP